MSRGFEIALWILLVLATFTDLRWGKIFNVLTIPYFFAGLVYCFAIGGVTGLVNGSIAVGVAIALYFPLYYLKVLAAGDVKLLMAIAPWVEAKVVIEIAAVSILFGACVGIAVMIRQTGFKEGVKSIAEHVQSFTPKRSTRMPFAPAFLCAFLFLKIAESYRWSLF